MPERMAVGDLSAENIQTVFKSFADTMPHMMWSARPDGFGDYYNRRWYDFTGFSPEVVSADCWERLVHPDDRSHALGAWMHSLATGEDFRAEYRLRHHSGEYRWVLGQGCSSRSATGAVERWFGTCTDIHDAKATEAALADSEERYRALTDASTAMVWRADPNGSVMKGWGWEMFSGQTPEEYEGDGWLNAVHPDDRDRVMEVWRDLLSDPRPGWTDYRVKPPEGGHRWFHVRTVPLKTPDGSVREWVGTITDIHERRQAEDSLRMSEERLRLAAETTGLGIWDVNMVSGERNWTQEACEILGLSAGAPLDGATFLARVHPDDRAEAERMFVSNLPPSAPGYDYTCRIRRADNGDERWVVISGRTIFDEDGHGTRKIGTIQDITHRKQSEEALRASEERLRLAMHAARMFAWEQDLRTDYVTRSQNSSEILGVGSGSLDEFLKRVHPEDRPLRERFSRQVVTKGSASVEFRFILPDGRMIWLGSRAEMAGRDRIVGVTHDISDRKTAEEEIWRTANHDPLTGLANRILFQRRVEEVLAKAVLLGGCASLLLIDLDDFKDVNDTVGHDAGDAILREAASRLLKSVRHSDTVARLGGDEFAILIADRACVSEATDIANRIIDNLREPFSYVDRTFVIRASIGVAGFPDHDQHSTELMKDADIALYRAKAEGRNRAVTYSPEMKTDTERRVNLVREMREALASNAIVPFYQPKVCLTTGRIIGFEALARWRHPTQGVLTPAAFGTMFEDIKVAGEIGRRMLSSVTDDMREWLDRGLDFGRMAVNLSSPEFMRDSLADEVLGLLTAKGIPAEHFEVEVTETVLLGHNAGHVPAILGQLHGAGVQIALDDFGTGYASLTHLKQFPVDHVKVDRSFVRDLESDPDDEAIVAAVIGLGRGLKLRVTAEGVETEGQAMRLRNMGCHSAQGYLYAKPMQMEEVQPLLSRWNEWPRSAAAAKRTG